MTDDKSPPSRCSGDGGPHRGQGKHPTINSYMNGDALAIAAIAQRAAKPGIANVLNDYPQYVISRKDYNHSSYCDLIISGLVGLRPRAADVVEVNPLIQANTWDYFCLDGIPYHGHLLTILYDKTGRKYDRGTGFRVLADGKEIAAAKTLKRLIATLP